MNETRLPSGDPHSTRIESEEGTGDIEIKLFPDEPQGIVISLWGDEESEETDAPVVILEDSDLRR